MRATFKKKLIQNTCFHPSKGARLIKADDTQTKKIIKQAVFLVLLLRYVTGAVIAQYLL